MSQVSEQVFPITGVGVLRRVLVRRYPNYQPSVVSKQIRSMNLSVVYEGHNRTLMLYIPVNGEYLLDDRTQTREPFLVYMTSLTRLGSATNLATIKTSPQILDYFKFVAKRQFGYHLYCNSIGTIDMMVAGLSQRDQNSEPKLFMTAVSSVSSIYPCVSYDRIDQGWTPQDIITRGDAYVTLGLLFGSQKGQRRYIRSSDHYAIHNYGNVMEMTEYTLGLLHDYNKKNTDIPDHSRCAIYMCAGAKLVVVDPYDPLNAGKSVAENQHNRSVVQQGGLVVMDGDIRWSMPYMTRPEYEDTVFTTEQAFRKGFLVPEDESLRESFAKIANPVVFLGAVESENESVCWGLNVEIKADGSRLFHIQVPEEALIVGLENWSAGWPEVVQRHIYERLYERVVDIRWHQSCLYTRHQFAQYFGAPSISYEKKILGLYPYNKRTITVAYEPIMQEVLNRRRVALQEGEDAMTKVKGRHMMYRLPHTKYPFRCAQLPANLSTPPIVPPVAPVSPLFYDARNGFFFTPKSDVICKYDTWFETYALSFDSDTTSAGQRVYKAYQDCGNRTIDEHQMNKLEFGDREDRLDGVRIRMGIDGWLYEKVGNPIGKYKLPLYKWDPRAGNYYYTDDNKLLPVPGPRPAQPLWRPQTRTQPTGRSLPTHYTPVQIPERTQQRRPIPFSPAGSTQSTVSHNSSLAQWRSGAPDSPSQPIASSPSLRSTSTESGYAATHGPQYLSLSTAQQNTQWPPGATLRPNTTAYGCFAPHLVIPPGWVH